MEVRRCADPTGGADIVGSRLDNRTVAAVLGARQLPVDVGVERFGEQKGLRLRELQVDPAGHRQGTTTVVTMLDSAPPPKAGTMMLWARRVSLP
jgi:hypothetical protein